MEKRKYQYEAVDYLLKKSKLFENFGSELKDYLEKFNWDIKPDNHFYDSKDKTETVIGFSIRNKKNKEVARLFYGSNRKNGFEVNFTITHRNVDKLNPIKSFQEKMEIHKLMSKILNNLYDEREVYTNIRDNMFNEHFKSKNKLKMKT